MKITISVTEEDIREADRLWREGAPSPYTCRCAVALAARRALPEADTLEVYGSRLEADEETYWLPSKATRFVRDFDDWCGNDRGLPPPPPIVFEVST